MDFFLAVQVDDYVYTSTENRLNEFEQFLSKSFDVGDFSRQSFTVMKAHLTQHRDHSITLSYDHSLEDIDPQSLVNAAGKKGANLRHTSKQIFTAT